MAKRNNYFEESIKDEDQSVTEGVNEKTKDDIKSNVNLKEETLLKSYTVLKGYEISHKGKKYKAGDKIELTDKEKEALGYGVK